MSVYTVYLCLKLCLQLTSKYWQFGGLLEGWNYYMKLLKMHSVLEPTNARFEDKRV